MCAPEAIAGHPAACAGVGASNEASNHLRTGSEKGSRGERWVAGVLMANLPTLQIRRDRFRSPASAWPVPPGR